MTLAYFDCFSGISGDMTLGALVALGVEVQWLKERLTRLPLSGFDIQARSVSPGGIRAVKIDVRIEENHHHRKFGHIRGLIADSPCSDKVKADSLAIFERIALAEAKIHDCDPEEVHFHEVGALDAIVDIVGTCLGLEYLGIDRLMASPLPLGGGFVRCAHGTLPVPAPAVVEILRGVPVYAGRQTQELVTPTGAGIVAALASGFEPLPVMRIDRIGYGAGSHELDNQPNLLRVMVGRSAIDDQPGGEETLLQVETCIDDMNPEIFGFLMDRLFEDGALDVNWIAAQMKKNRPGILVRVLCAPEHRAAVVGRILSETTSLGVRYHDVRRVTLQRQAVEVETPLGRVAAKKIIAADGTERIVPEFESCKKIALARQLPLRQVYDCVNRASRIIKAE
jgi:uncharacterized protein (TIGR00299 family) protein